jgi:hypothetical protein
MNVSSACRTSIRNELVDHANGLETLPIHACRCLEKKARPEALRAASKHLHVARVSETPRLLFANVKIYSRGFITRVRLVILIRAHIIDAKPQ